MLSGLDLDRVIRTSFFFKKVGLSVNCLKLWSLLSLLVFRSLNLVLGVNNFKIKSSILMVEFQG